MINLVEKIRNIKILNELELDNKKLLLIFIISAAVLYLDLNFILKAQLSGLNNKNAEIVRLKGELTNLERDLKSMDEAKARQNLAAKAPIPKAKKIILESHVSDLLQDISKLANSNDVRILQIKPTRQEKATPADSKFITGGNLSSLLIYMDLSGGYHQLGKFINDLENAQAFVVVQELKIESQPGNYVRQKAALTLKTYVKK